MKNKFGNRQLSEKTMRKLESINKRIKISAVLSGFFIILFFISKFIGTANWQKILGSLAVLCILMSLAHLLEIYKIMTNKGEENEK